MITAIVDPAGEELPFNDTGDGIVIGNNQIETWLKNLETEMKEQVSKRIRTFYLKTGTF